MKSNRCASFGLAGALALVLMLPFAASAQEADAASKPESSPLRTTVTFLAGAAAAFGAHEAGHLTSDLLFDADPRLKRVDFHGIPFFAITHRVDVTPRQRLVIASSGFWVQHVTSEIILTRTPRIRDERAAFRKGMLAFNVLASGAYAGAAFARTGPDERDTRGMAEGARLDERWIGTMVLAPAALDTIRYFNPDAKWAVWASRAAKAGLVLLVLR